MGGEHEGLRDAAARFPCLDPQRDDGRDLGRIKSIQAEGKSLEEARNIFDGLRSPRKDLLGQLLSCCASVKAVRLFLTWARETSLVDVDALLEQYPVRTGSNTRWMSRLDDGTLLSLRPHG